MNAFSLWWIRSLMRLQARLPLGWQPALGRLWAVILWLAGGRRKRIAARNLELCFPDLAEAERKQLLRAHFHALGMSMVELPLAWFGDHQRLRPLARIHGLEHVQHLQQQGQGVLLVAAHFTCLEMAGCLLGQYLDYDGMYRSHKHARFDALQKQARLRFTGTMYPRDRVRQVIRALKQGRTIWYAPDQDYGRNNSVFVPFFGVPACTLTATHKLARLSGARVVLMETIRNDRPWGYDIRLSEPLEHFPGEDELADTARISEHIEAMVRKAPAQYLWVHRRFKTRPEGEPGLY